MRLVLMRDVCAETHTHGKLFVNSEFFCYTLEDTDRRLEEGGIKIQHETAIPLGTYPLLINMSPRFQRRLPLINRVPGFIGIRIHAGNTSKDTSGCILVGNERKDDKILHSVDAFNKLFKLLDNTIASGESVSITILR